ncbi:AfsR/SARP family transcriptional regulator [Nocardiopsis coralliicola]
MRFAVLGAVEVRDAGGGERAVRLSPKLTRLLALLLCSPSAPVPEDRLKDALWDGAPPPSAHKSLQVYIHHLRQALGGAPEIAREVRGYRLQAGPADLDAARFERLRRRARAAAEGGSLDRAAELLREALDLWRGPAFGGIADTPGIRDEAARLDEERWSATEDLVRAELDLGRHDGLVAELTALVAEHPLRERMRGALMLALYRTGRAPEALDVFRRGSELLAEELGVDPGRELRALHTAILREEPALDSPYAPPAPGGRSAETRAGAAAGGPAGGDAAVPAQLPADLADFTGRGDHLHEIRAHLAAGRPPGSVPVVAVSGMGGVGKTSLALHAAHAAAADHPGGQLYADLRGAEAPVDPARVLAGFLHALGIDGAALPEGAEDRAALYRSLLAERRMLVVLDDAASAAQIAPLLPGGAGCSVLVTSRARLTGLDGARHIPLDVLAPGQAAELLGRIVGPERVAAAPGDAAALVRLCGYTPLAVRIVGGRLAARPQWPLERMVRMLGDEGRRLDELSSGDRAVRASIELSHRGLGGRAQRAFRLLGALDVPDAAEWTVAALLDVGVEQAAEPLSALVDAQLVTEFSRGGRLRYRMHDLVRLYARELGLADPEHTAALDRAFGAWLWLAEQATEYIPGACYATLHGGADRWPLPSEAAGEALNDPMGWFDGEWQAIAAAVRQACELGRDEAAWDLAGSIEKYFDVRGRFDDWRRTHELALAACRAAGNRFGEAALLRGMADLVTWVTPGAPGDAMGAMLEQADRVEALFRELDEPRGICDALVMRTWGLVSQGRHQAATEAAERSLERARGIGYLGGQARAYHVLAIAAYEGQRIEDAIGHLTEALELARLIGNSRFEATAMQFLGAAQCLSGRIDTGRTNLLRSLDMARSLGDRYAEVFSLLYLTRLYTAVGDEAALATARTAAELSRRHGMDHHLADSLTLIGEIHLAEGRSGPAVATLEESVALWRTRGWPSFLADALDSLAGAYAAAARPAASSAARAEAARLRTAPDAAPTGVADAR